MPISLHARQKSGSGIFEYGQRDTDCFSRPVVAGKSDTAIRGQSAGAAAATPIVLITSRRFMVFAVPNGIQVPGNANLPDARR